MPWTASDAKRHTKKANTPEKRKKWAKVANSARKQCIADGGDADECDGRAIRIANAAIAEKGRAMDNIVNKLRQLWEQFIEGVQREIEENPAEEEALERAIGTYRLHEQFYALLREEADDWPRVLDIYLDDAAMYGLVVSEGKLFRYPLAITDDDLQITGEREQVMEIHQPTEARAISIHRQADGRVRWTATACTAILNREGEIDSRELFDNMIRRAEEGDHPYLTFWHQGEALRMGQADFLARDGVVYIASGLFDEGELSEAAVEGLETDPEYWGTSIRFLPVGQPEMAKVAPEIQIPVYRDGKHIEISILPEHRASAWFTATGVGEEVTRMRQEVEEALRKLLGDERAEKWIGRVDDINRTATAEGMITREEGDQADAQDAQDAPPDGTQQQDAAPEGDPSPAVELDDEAVDAIIRGVVESGPFKDQFAALEATAMALSEMMQILTKGLESNVAASTEALVQTRERLDKLERDEEEKQREWMADLPASRTLRVSYRPREANAPEGPNGPPRRASLADVADGTLSSIPSYSK